MSAAGIPSSRSLSGRKTSCGLALWSFGSNMVSPPDAVAAFPSAKAVVGAIGQIEVHGIASRITVEVVEDQARAFQRGLDPGLYVLFPPLLPLRQAAIAGDLVQAIERVRKSAKFGGVLSSIARRTFSD